MDIEVIADFSTLVDLFRPKDNFFDIVRNVCIENIGNFLDGCYAYGLNKTDVFQIVDLYEGENMARVRSLLRELVFKICEDNNINGLNNAIKS